MEKPYTKFFASFLYSFLCCNFLLLSGIILLSGCGKENDGDTTQIGAPVASTPVAVGIQRKNPAQAALFPEKNDDMSFLHQDFQNMKDPFVPLVQPQAHPLSPPPSSPVPSSSNVSDTVLRVSPLEALDLSSLRLTAVLFAGKEKWALVEEQGGKGHEVRVGMPLGNHRGKVIRILQDRILVQEMGEDGIKNIRELVLHKNWD